MARGHRSQSPSSISKQAPPPRSTARCYQSTRRSSPPWTRARQYERLDVTGLVDPAPATPVWAYVGRPPGRARVAAGHAGTLRVAIQRAYMELIEATFAALGEDVLARYRTSTELPPFPVIDLTRIDLLE